MIFSAIPSSALKRKLPGSPLRCTQKSRVPKHYTHGAIVNELCLGGLGALSKRPCGKRWPLVRNQGILKPLFRSSPEPFVAASALVRQVVRIVSMGSNVR